MQKQISAKWVILLTVLINVVTTFTVVTLLSPSVSMANAKNTVNCIISKPIFQSFADNSGTTYQGFLYANSGGNPKLASMTITFTGTAPNSKSDRGSLTAVDFTATALPDTPFSSFFKDMNGQLATENNVNTYLSDFRVDLSDGGQVHFIGGSFTSKTQPQISGMFDINGGQDDKSNGSWVVNQQ